MTMRLAMFAFCTTFAIILGLNWFAQMSRWNKSKLYYHADILRSLKDVPGVGAFSSEGEATAPKSEPCKDTMDDHPGDTSMDIFLQSDTPSESSCAKEYLQVVPILTGGPGSLKTLREGFTASNTDKIYIDEIDVASAIHDLWGRWFSRGLSCCLLPCRHSADHVVLIPPAGLVVSTLVMAVYHRGTTLSGISRTAGWDGFCAFTTAHPICQV